MNILYLLRIACSVTTSNTVTETIYLFSLLATNYKVDLLIWNKEVRWGYITVKLGKGENVTVASIEQ